MRRAWSRLRFCLVERHGCQRLCGWTRTRRWPNQPVRWKDATLMAPSKRVLPRNIHLFWIRQLPCVSTNTFHRSCLSVCGTRKYFPPTCLTFWIHSMWRVLKLKNTGVSYLTTRVGKCRCKYSTSPLMGWEWKKNIMYSYIYHIYIYSVWCLQKMRSRLAGLNAIDPADRCRKCFCKLS